MYMKKNVNLILLVMVVTVLIGTVAITTYFDTTYTEVAQNLEQKQQMLDVVSSNFTSKISELNKTYSELQLKQLDKEKLDQLYTQLLKDKEQTDAELTSTKGTLTLTLSELAETKTGLSDANYKLLIQEQELGELKVKVSNLGSTINQLQAQVETLKKQLCDEKTAQGKQC